MQFNVPGAFWWILVPTLIGALLPVIAQFYPPNEFFWSALIVAVGGAVLSAVAQYRNQTTSAQYRNQTTSKAPPGVAATPAPQRSLLSRWFWG